MLTGTLLVCILRLLHVKTGVAAHLKQQAQSDSKHMLGRQALLHRHLDAAHLQANWKTTTSCVHELPEGVTMHSKMASAYRDVHCYLNPAKGLLDVSCLVITHIALTQPAPCQWPA